MNNVTAASTGIVAASAENPVILRVGGTLTLDGQVIDLTPVAVEAAAPEVPAEDGTDASVEGQYRCVH